MAKREIGWGLLSGLTVVLALGACGDDGAGRATGDAAPGSDGGSVPRDGTVADAASHADAASGGGDAARDGGGTGTDAGPIALARCDEPLEGVDFGDGAGPEAEPGIEADLEAVNIDALPASVDISGITGLFRGFIAYALETPVADLGGALDRDATLAQGPLGRVVLASIAAGQGTAFGLDFELFRRGFHRYYTCEKGVPTTLDGFRALVYDFSGLSSVTVDSAAKCGPRRIRFDASAGVHVAETLVDGAVRETEILLTNNRTDGQLDFFVYSADGVLTDRSVFPTVSSTDVVGAAPYVCMGCHVENTGPGTPVTFETVHPDLGVCN